MKNILLTALLLVLGCTAKKVPTARDPIWGKQECAHCRMIVSEERYAAQFIEASGKTHYYDDIGCALRHAEAEGFDVDRIFVRPHPGERWVPASEAKFQGALKTPMNSGFGALTEGGDLGFSDVKAGLSKKGPSNGTHSH